MLHVPLSSDAEAMLRERAKATGEDVSSYAARLLLAALVTPTVDELLAPFRKEVEQSGITDAELNQLGEELRTEVWREQQAGKAPNS